MKKIIFIDVDGTLRNDNKEVTKRTIEALNKVKSIDYEIVICTGRPADFAAKVNIECNGDRYIIFNNGAGILDTLKNKIIYQNGMNKDSLFKLYNLAEAKGFRFIIATNGTRYVNKLKHFDGTETLIEGPVKNFINNNEIVQATISCIDYNLIKSSKEEMANIPELKIVNSDKRLIDPTCDSKFTPYYDFGDINSSKGNGIKKYCEMFNMPLKDTISIGDDNNDISMFEVCNYNVAMDNAFDNIKKMANYITDDNNNDGVAKFLEKLYMEEKK